MRSKHFTSEGSVGWTVERMVEKEAGERIKREAAGGAAGRSSSDHRCGRQAGV